MVARFPRASCAISLRCPLRCKLLLLYDCFEIPVLFPLRTLSSPVRSLRALSVRFLRAAYEIPVRFVCASRPASGQDLAGFWQDPGPHLARLWQDLARTWQGTGKIWPESDPIAFPCPRSCQGLARFGPGSCQNLARSWPDSGQDCHRQRPANFAGLPQKPHGKLVGISQGGQNPQRKYHRNLEAILQEAPFESHRHRAQKSHTMHAATSPQSRMHTAHKACIKLQSICAVWKPQAICKESATEWQAIGKQTGRNP